MNALIIFNTIVSVILLALVARPYLRSKKLTRAHFEAALASAAASLSEAQEWVEIEKQARLSKPIHHPPVEGPRTAKVNSAIGYWRPKDAPNAEPFLAAWYEKDTTYLENGTVFSPEDNDLPSEEPMVMPADTYVDLMGRKINGPKFRALYEPAEAIMEVSKFKPRNPLRNTNLVTAKATATLTPEEEQRLAEEYELGGHVADRLPFKASH